MKKKRIMFDAQCDLAALVYDQHEDPDQILREFASDLNARGYRAVGIVQLGHHCMDARLSAMLVHTGEELQLFQNLGTCSAGSMSASCWAPANGSQARSIKAPTS